MERMWRDESHEVWQAVFTPHDPRIVMRSCCIRAACSCCMTRMERHAMPENPAWVNRFHFAHAYPAQEKPQWARGCVGYQIFPDRFRRVDVPGRKPLSRGAARRVVNEYRFGGNLKGILKPCRIWRELGVGMYLYDADFPLGYVASL